MADCVPFLGLDDLREILTAVLLRKASAPQHCRPLKVTNYLQVRERGKLVVDISKHLNADKNQANVEIYERLQKHVII